MKTLLFKPFEKYSENKLLIIGFIFTLLGSFIAYVFQMRFDGVLDAHFVSKPLYYQALIDNLINIFCLFLFLYISAKYVNKKTRFIDILTTSIIARIPLYLIPFANINGVVSKKIEDIVQLASLDSLSQISSSTLLILTVYGVVIILFVVWYIFLLFNGFKVASNAKGKVSNILFIMSVLFAEILSKFLTLQFN